MRTSRGAALAASAIVAALLSHAATAYAAGPELWTSVEPSRVPIRAELAVQLAGASAEEIVLVLVTGDTTNAALAAVEAAELTTVEVFDRLSIVAAQGNPDAIRAVHDQQGVLRVDANLPLEFLDDIAHRSTGVAQLRDTKRYPQLRQLRRSAKSPYDGTGVSIAVVDSGFDTTHAQFVEDGETKFDVHLRQACPYVGEDVYYITGIHPAPNRCSAWVPAVPAVDDAALGHGTVVAGVAAGYPRTTPSGARVSGTAPGARIVGLSVGAGALIYNTVSALNWVLEHHADPCGDGSCPPIRVVNNSYGAPADDRLDQRQYDPQAPMSVVTTELINAGVVVVFAAGNDGGDGSTNNTNILALHPLPGMLGVGAFFDDNAGDRYGGIAPFSSRGLKGNPATYADVAAPGASYLMGCTPASVLCATGAKDGAAYGVFRGTSLAAPYVAGLVAQLLEADPSLTPAQVEDILEDSASQRFIPRDLLEPDRYREPDGRRRGNGDHHTSFHAGHGLVDAVGALSAVLRGASRVAPEPCPTRKAEASIGDPVGDAPLTGSVPSPLGRPGFDIVEVTGSVLRKPGALTVGVVFDDLPEAHPYMHLTTAGFLDLGTYFEVDFDRSLAGDSFSVFEGDVRVEGTVDPDTDTVTFVIRPLKGSVRTRAGVGWAWTSNSNQLEADVDFTNGACSLWTRA